MRDEADELAAIEARMASGEPFTYGELCDLRRVKNGYNNDEGRLADRTIQRWRRAGKIAYQREGGRVVWRLVAQP